MTAQLISLAGARVDRDDRLRAHIDKIITAEVAKSSERMDRYIQWLRMKPEERAAFAANLAQEIKVRYDPIARQFKNALHDAIVLYVAEAQLRGEDLSVGLLRGLMLMMSDERYIEIAKHFVREPYIRQLGDVDGEGYRRREPSPIDKACDSLFEAYAASAKK